MKQKKPKTAVPHEKPNLVLAHTSERTKIRHRNAINETFSRMPLSAKRVLFLMLAQFDPKKPLGRDIVFSVCAEDYARLCGINKNSAYRQLRDASMELQRQLIEIPKEDLLPLIPRAGDLSEFMQKGKIEPKEEEENEVVRMFHVTQWVDYAYNTGYINICPSRQFEPYIAAIHGDYTSQTLLSALRLADRNAGNVYQFLREAMCSPGHADYIDITVDELKDRLGLYRIHYNKKQYRYPEYTVFKRDVINKALLSINNSTELDVNVSVVSRRGRKTHMLRFSYVESKQHTLDF